MSKAQRDKGLRGEREVAERFRAAGMEVRGLEGSGDHLVVRHLEGGFDLHLEVKRQETLCMDKWSRQAEAEAPRGAIPLMIYRRNREPWRVSLLLEDLIGLL